MPAPPAKLDGDFVRASQVYGRYAHVVDDAGRAVFAREPTWSETDLAQAIARQPGGTAWYVVDSDAIPERVGGRYTVGEMISHAVGCGAEVPLRAPTLDALGLGPLVSPSSPAAVLRREGGRRRHAHPRRPAGRRAGPGAARRTDRRSTACTRRASTREASRRAATRAAWRLRSCSVSPPRKRSPAARGPDRGAQRTGWRYAQRRSSPGSGEGATFVTTKRLFSSSTSAPTGGGSPSPLLEPVAARRPDEEHVRHGRDLARPEPAAAAPARARGGGRAAVGGAARPRP